MLGLFVIGILAIVELRSYENNQWKSKFKPRKSKPSQGELLIMTLLDKYGYTYVRDAQIKVANQRFKR